MRLTQLYFGLLPIFLMPTSTLGLINGLQAGFDYKKNKYPFASFCETIGYTSIGIITGITYPISFPLLAGYVLLQKPKPE